MMTRSREMRGSSRDEMECVCLCICWNKTHVDNFCPGFSQSWMPLLDWSFQRGNRTTNPLWSLSSTVCGSWSGSGSGHAFWCTAAFTAPRRYILPTTFVELPTSTVVAVYALPSQTRWSWHQRTVQHSTTVLSQLLYQQRVTACLPQSEPLRHCRHFVRKWRRFSSGGVFSDTSRPVAYHFWHCIQHVCCVLIDIVNCLCNVTVIMCISNNNNKL